MMRFLGWSVLVVVSLLMLWTSLLKVQSYVIGIYTQVNVHTGEIQDMQRVWREYAEWLGTQDQPCPNPGGSGTVVEVCRWIDITEWLNWEREKAKHEIKILNVLEPLVQALDRANQIGR